MNALGLTDRDDRAEAITPGIQDRTRQRRSALTTFALAALVFTPVFFQLDGTLFTDPRSLTAPRGNLTNLPVPVSLIACAAVLVWGLRDRTIDPLTLLLFSSLPLMFLTSLVAGEGAISWAKSKLLIFQFGVPLTGFVVGRQLGLREGGMRWLGVSLLFITTVWSGAHLASSWLRSTLAVLAPDVFGLGVYSHLQYVPQVLVAAYLIGFCASWDRNFPGARASAYVSVPIMAVYVAASMSMTAILGLWLGLAALTISPYARPHRLAASILLVVAVVCSSTYLVAATSRHGAFQAKFLGLREPTTSTEHISPQPVPAAAAAAPATGPAQPTTSPPPMVGEDEKVRPLANVSERLDYWRYFSQRSFSSAPAFLFGHPEQPDIRILPSAHNYYLDFLYNFGALAMLPVLILIALTARAVWAAWAAVTSSAALGGVVMAAILLLVVDNSLKVGMRQLYPGIATFLIWGFLLSRCSQPTMRSSSG